MIDQIVSYFQYLWGTYRSVSVLIELAMIGFVVYSVTRFLRGTGGERLLKGLVVVVLGFWILSALTVVLDLERIRFLFQYFLVGVLAVAAIAFQPELRRGLMRLGGATFSRTSVPHMAQVIEQVVDATAVMAKAKIGAIIAFEREVGLADLVASGTPLDGEVTADLLRTIFWPGSPLHDMGVVVRGGKVAAAGVQFPLAEYGEFDRLLGSRHRAAIGLSKESDAVILVISEETGAISLATDGKLNRFLTLEQLRHQLRALMLPVVARHKGPFSLPRPLGPRKNHDKSTTTTSKGTKT
jgi:diadenylate cyclase